MGKISREFPLGGFSPCGNRLAPCRKCMLSSLFGNFSNLTHLFFTCLFCMFFVFFYLFIFSFSCAFHWISHRIPKRNKKRTKNPKSRSKSVEACLPNTCVCPTALSPKSIFELPYHSFWWKNWVVCPIFLFLLSKLRCFTWNFGSWLVSPKNQDIVFFANSSAQWAKCQAGNHPKTVQSLAHKRFVSQKSGTTKNGWEKFRESFVSVQICG